MRIIFKKEKQNFFWGESVPNSISIDPWSVIFILLKSFPALEWIENFFCFVISIEWISSGFYSQSQGECMKQKHSI